MGQFGFEEESTSRHRRREARFANALAMAGGSGSTNAPLEIGCASMCSKAEARSSGTPNRRDGRRHPPKDFLFPAESISDFLSHTINLTIYRHFGLDKYDSSAILGHKASPNGPSCKGADLFKGSAYSKRKGSG